MRNRISLPLIVNAALFFVASLVIIFVTWNYSWQFFVACVFYLLAGLCACYSVTKWQKQPKGNFPIKVALLFISYSFWGIAATVAFWIGSLTNLPIKLFLLFELLPFACFVGLVAIMQAILQKGNDDDAWIKLRDSQLSEIMARLTVVQSKIQMLPLLIVEKTNYRMTELLEAVKYSDILSQHYDEGMIQLLYNGITSIELEVDALLDVQPDNLGRLEELISQLLVTVKNNNEACKASKR